MTKLDFVWFLIAGIIGGFSSYERGPASPVYYGRSLAWLALALFGLLGLVGAIA